MLCKGIFGQANIFNAFQLLVPHCRPEPDRPRLTQLTEFLKVKIFIQFRRLPIF